MKHAGVPCFDYRYYDNDTNEMNITGLLEDIRVCIHYKDNFNNLI